jgi:hypothetical protein
MTNVEMMEYQRTVARAQRANNVRRALVEGRHADALDLVERELAGLADALELITKRAEDRAVAERGPVTVGTPWWRRWFR